MPTKLTMVKFAAEAVCSALHTMDFRFIGETNEGASTWFTRGEVPKIMRVEVQRSQLADCVLVKTEWGNVSGPQFVKGQNVDEIWTHTPEGDPLNEAMIFEHVEAVVVHTLEIFRDVLAGEGVAGVEAIQHLDFS